MSRGPDYTPEELREAAEKYFRSITYARPVRDPETGEPVCDPDGQPMTEYRFAVVPSKYVLCYERLHIDYQTLTNYGNRPEYREVTDWINALFEDWNRRELLTRSGKDVRGVEFNLACNYGWTATQHVEITGGVEDFLRKKQGSGSDF